MYIQPVVWDSDFFKLQIGKVVQDCFVYKDIDSIYAEAKKRKFKLLYIESGNQLSFTKPYRGTLRLVDIKTSLQIKITQNLYGGIDWNIVEYDDSRVTPELEQLAYESGVYSRFHTDSMFPDKLFKKLYKKWINNCVNKTSADIVFVCLNDQVKPIGFVTVIKHGNRSHIGLISVAKQYRKKRIGFSLLQKAIYWSFLNKCNYLTITTQFNNISAMNLYKKCGFKIIEKKYYYHYWI